VASHGKPNKRHVKSHQRNVCYFLLGPPIYGALSNPHLVEGHLDEWLNIGSKLGCTQTGEHMARVTPAKLRQKPLASGHACPVNGSVVFDIWVWKQSRSGKENPL
jgi:hypothetical protein